MASDASKRERLVHFLEQRAFALVIQASPHHCQHADRAKRADLQRKSECEKRRSRSAHDDLSDLHSAAGKRKTGELAALDLPSLKHELLALCDRLGAS